MTPLKAVLRVIKQLLKCFVGQKTKSKTPSHALINTKIFQCNNCFAAMHSIFPVCCFFLYVCTTAKMKAAIAVLVFVADFNSTNFMLIFFVSFLQARAPETRMLVFFPDTKQCIFLLTMLTLMNGAIF